MVNVIYLLLLLLIYKCCGLIQMVGCPGLFNTPKCNYQEIKAEIRNSHVCLLILNLNVFSILL